MSDIELIRPDIILVEASHEVEVEAVAADLHIVIKGTSLFTGSAALSKAREVSVLVNELKTFGLADAEISLEGVYAAVSTGVLGRNSAANYALKVRCTSLDRLADILGIVTSQKNTTLRKIEWDLGDTNKSETDCLVKCIEISNSRARIVAEGMGVKLLGVHRFTSQSFYAHTHESKHDYTYRGSVPAKPMLAQAIGMPDLGMDISHKKPLTITVSVEYRISEFVKP